jgi:GDP-L-fucose synthase
MFENKKILVTGGSGMIGRELVTMLLDRGAEITVASLDSPRDMDERVNFKPANLTLKHNCEIMVKGMDMVFHLAGIKGSPLMCQKKPASFSVPMQQFNLNMMEAAVNEDVEWYLYTSSVGVYKPAEVFYEDDVWKTFPSENDRFAGWAKRMGELQAQAYSIENDWNRVSIVRPANVYGNYDNFDPETAMVIPSLICKASSSPVLDVWGDGSPIRDFIHARDVARGMMHMVENKVIVPVNLGSGKGVTIKEIAESVAKSFGSEREINWQVDKPTGDAKRLLSMERANSLGFYPEISLEDGISETVDWFLNNQSLVGNRHNAFK